MPTLYIAVYKPRYGNHFRWALYLKSESPKVFEVIGEHPQFQRNVVEMNAEDIEGHVANVMVGEVNDGDVPALESIVQGQNSDNDTVLWDCQDYVLEVMENLAGEYVIDGDDECYAKGRREAMMKYHGFM